MTNIRVTNIQRCAAVECKVYIANKRFFCPCHERNPANSTEAGKPAPPPSPPGTSERAKIFEQRLANADYRALFDARVIQVMNEAAEHLKKHGLGDEIGALRFVLARLLAEEEDLTRLAGNVSRVVSVAVQAAKAQRAISGEVATGLIEALTKILDELAPAGGTVVLADSPGS